MIKIVTQKRRVPVGRLCEDRKNGTGIFIGTSTAMGGPLSGVWGDGKENTLSNETIKIQTDSDENFTGVIVKNKGREEVVSPDDYNKTISNRKVWNLQNDREDYKNKK
jgi:hypothetical protein